jgi:prepilin-type N-terminal cleavage/methylation domain-containing protein
MANRLSKKGFTLVELLVTMVLISIFTVGLASFNVMAIKSNSYSRLSTQATVLAKDKMEALKNMNYDAMVSGGPETVGTIFSRQWTVENNVPVSNTKTVTVNVSWLLNGVTRTVTIRSIIDR